MYAFVEKHHETKNMVFDDLVLPELQLLSLQKRLMNGDHVRREDSKRAGPGGNGARKRAT